MQSFLHEADVQALFPSIHYPELLAVGVVGEEKNVALENAQPFQLREALCDELRAETFAATRGRNRQVMQIAAAAIVATKDGANEFPPSARHEAHPAIPAQITRDRMARIRFVQ